ncbi:MAG: hypothetical protein JWP27_417 [Flaviaesturariibacter sp.]|nr:hypothetical protein [Flaviaesturariibacter sp.]
MEQEQTHILEPLLRENNIRRRKLLPTWIKIILWIFLVMGAVVPLAFLAGLLGGNFSMSLYSLQSVEPLSGLGLLIGGLYVLKGVVAIGLWTEKRWAVDLATADAVIGIVICFTLTVMSFVSGWSDGLRLELVALVPYLVCMRRIRARWVNYGPVDHLQPGL